VKTSTLLKSGLIILLALHEIGYISLYSGLYNKNELYESFNCEIGIKYGSKSYNDYITPYLSNDVPDGKKEITKSEVAEMKIKIGANRCDT
jgi:hypothetical protein